MPQLELSSRSPRSLAAVALFTLVVLVTIAAGRLRAAPAQATLVRCDPVAFGAEIGETVTFAIYVENVVELYAADVQMSFDPSVAQVIDANPDRGGTQIEILDDFLSSDFVVRDRADNVAGTIWYANTQLNPTEPVSGSGPLARVTMQSLGPGFFNMVITSQELATNTGAVIPSTTINCRVNFFDPNATSTIFMPVAISP